MYLPIIGDTTYAQHSMQCFSGASSKIEEIDDVRNILLSALVQIKQWHLSHDLKDLFETDCSTTQPRFEIKNEKSYETLVFKEFFPIEILEHDIIVCIPPSKKYSIEIDVQSIIQGKPTIINSDDLL